MSASVVDMTGKRYANVIALRLFGRNASRGCVWSFLCDCGKTFNATGSEVRYGRIKSCPECSAKSRIALVTTHGLANHHLYGVWCGMKSRCNNINHFAYQYYGARGISVCDRWIYSFENFLSDMGDRPTPEHTLERKDSNGNYEPSNCIWATPVVQANNKRNNRFITIDGKTMTIAQWSHESGLVTESGIRSRFRRGVRGTDLLKADPKCFSLIFNGEKKTLAQWAEYAGIKKGTLANRLYVYGWSLERALTEKVSK